MSETTDSPHPSLEEIRRQEVEEEQQQARDLGVTFRKMMADGGGKASETVAIKRNGQLAVEDEGGNLKSLFVHLAYEGPEELYRMARVVEEQCSDLGFNFERDPEGKWIKYTVNKRIQDISKNS